MSIMSEEENIAIETLKEVASDDFDTLGDDISPKMAQNILNIIDNQKKEIQRLEKDNDTLSKLVIVNEDKVIKELDLISKDKIKELKEKVEKEMINNPYDFSYMINELLEENNNE